jgi:hypothetical protein
MYFSISISVFLIMFAECYGSFGFDLRAETVEDDSIFDYIPNLSNKSKTEAKADAKKCQQNACDKYGWPKCIGYEPTSEIGCKSVWETFCCYSRSAVIKKSCSPVDMKIIELFEAILADGLEKTQCKAWQRKYHICKVYRS